MFFDSIKQVPFGSGVLEGRRGNIFNFYVWQFFMRGRGGDGILNNFCFSQIGGIWRGGDESFVKFY
jgi:hypothetical protein